MKLAFGVAVWCVLSGQSPAVKQAEPAPDWNARFVGKRGWIGGDGVASALLDARRVVWLFGDTLVGEVKDGGRAGAAMVNNSIAVSGRDKNAFLSFRFGKEKNGKPTAFFTPAEGGGWFWPLSAIRVGSKLYLFLTQVEKTDAKGVFGFRLIGQWLLAVDNPDDEPDAWRVRQRKLPFAQVAPNRDRSWGSAALAHKGFLYVYGYLEEGKGLDRRKLTIARVPVEKIEDFTLWRFLAQDGWSDNAADAKGLARGLATEFSVSALGERRFAMVYTESGLGDRIVGRFANEPDGPWSEPLLLYRCPEMAGDKGVFTYAGKAHAWASGNQELLVSYCVNTWDFGRLFRDEKVYRPQFVRVRLEP
jgi:hypothetical protein